MKGTSSHLKKGLQDDLTATGRTISNELHDHSPYCCVLSQKVHTHSVPGHTRRDFRNWIWNKGGCLKQDNDPKDTAKITQEGLAWPSQSTGLNPIENWWRILKLQIHQVALDKLENLKINCQEEWGTIKTWSRTLQKHFLPYTSQS